MSHSAFPKRGTPVGDLARNSSNDFKFIFELDDLLFFALALEKIGAYLSDKKVDAMLCPMRGAFPATRMLEEYLIPGWGYIDYLPTSNFVVNHDEIIRTGIRTCLEELAGSQQEELNIATLDTVITGSSSRRYIQMLETIIPWARREVGIPEDQKLVYNMFRIWKKPGQHTSRCKNLQSRERKGYTFVDYCIAVPSLLTEDEPELLGWDYKFPSPTIGKKLENLQRVVSDEPIAVVAGDHIDVFNPSEKYTSDMLITLILDILRGRNYAEQYSAVKDMYWR